MKWIFLGALLLFIPTLTALLRSNPKYLVPCCLVLGLMPFIIVPGLYVAPVSWAQWPGPVKGIEVSLVDGLSLAIIMATRRVRIPMALKLSFGVVALAVVISSIASYQLMPALFYAWQLFRAVLLFVAVTRVCANVRDAPLAIVTGLGLGLCYEAVLAFIQYTSGVAKPGGNLGHSNFLGLATHFVLYPSLAFLLAGRRTAFFSLVVAASILIALVGGSRATLGLVGIGMLLTLAASLRHRSSSGKYTAAGLVLVLLIVATPATVASLDYRTEDAKISSDLERKDMKDAARMIIADHPLGIGANQYVLVANIGGYSERAGVPWNVGSREAPVHNVYYLVSAELGLVGLAGLMALLVTLNLTAFTGIRKHLSDPRSELIPGLFVTLVMVTIHISYEWVFMHFVIHYLFAIIAGLLVGLKYALRRSTVDQSPRRIQTVTDGEPVPALAFKAGAAP